MSDELSEEMKLRIQNIAGMKMLTAIADDPEIAELAREFPTPITRIFMFGCQAGAESAITLVMEELNDRL